jgi:predicted nucleotidyltransferase component of viral defense system
MTKERPSNIEASVRQRLLSIIRETGENANIIWTRYAIERLLYRLSISKYAEGFVLKGAILFRVWTEQSYRPTIDLDLLCDDKDYDARLVEIFRNICVLEAKKDGLIFVPESVEIMPIREEQEYHGQRITLIAFLGKARIPLQVDIGFGDVVTPKAKKIHFPTLLSFPAPELRAYPPETVVAEKLHAMVILGLANSRMKDFYDIYNLAKIFSFDRSVLLSAIKATFRRRKTKIPAEIPLALTDDFGGNEMKSIQWQAFIKKNGLSEFMLQLQDILSYLREFLLPLLDAASSGDDISRKWNKSGHWS